ncbi:MAG: isoprenylcysteine carboxylmethyltransferase family protein [Chloroflexota bacterium]|nr:isoprenylcysteine carboxylmethyltransferase family protein [Chloroflexota bacterium]
MALNRYQRLAQRWARHEYSAARRAVALPLLGLLFVVALPALIVFAAAALDAWFHLPRLVFAPVNIAVAAVAIAAGGFVALWAIKAQFDLGRGTPAPMMPTQRLVVRPPFSYCRNPMSLGTIVLYLGIAIWTGSLSALGLVVLFTAPLMVYNRFIEERELAERFGDDYIAYREDTPFLIPRLRGRG